MRFNAVSHIFYFCGTVLNKEISILNILTICYTHGLDVLEIKSTFDFILDTVTVINRYYSQTYNKKYKF